MTAVRSLEELALERAHDPARMRSIASEVRRYLDDDSSGHDMHHAWRVFMLGTRLARETGADEAVVQAAALTHDLHRTMGDPGEYIPPETSLPDVRAILEEAGCPEPVVSAVLHCVAVHDTYAYRGLERPPETVEAEVLRDADNLDAMGAVGIARTFAFTGIVGNPLWEPTGEGYSGLGHFEDKLLRLVDELHTEPARALAEERHAFLETFVDRFEAEWFGRA